MKESSVISVEVTDWCAQQFKLMSQETHVSEQLLYEYAIYRMAQEIQSVVEVRRKAFKEFMDHMKSEG